MVLIANPIYDVVFKYLMHEEKVAKLLLSAIIGREVTELEFRPTESAIPYRETLTVLRMDFSARVLMEDGSQELVIIELQKAKLPTDIMRFRRYLGEQYGNTENVVREPQTEYKKALPILSIYFLGHKLEHTTAPVVRVNRRYIDVATGEEIQQREEFIESLTHDSIIIQIPFLTGKRRTELEQLLALFDQSNTSTNNGHFLDFDETQLPERYYPIIRRLQKATAESKVRSQMDAEDDFIEDIKIMERQVQIAKEELEQQNTQLKQQDSQLKQQDSQLKQQDSQLKQQDSLLKQQDSLLKQQHTQLENAIRLLRQTGTDITTLAVMFDKSQDEIRNILGR